MEKVTTARRVRLAAVSFAQRAPSNPAAFDARVEGHIRYAADCGAEAIVFPEYVGSSLLALGGDWEQWRAHSSALFGRLAREYGLAIVGGTHPEIRCGQTFNVARTYLADGAVHAQEKCHATPFERTHWGMSGNSQVTLLRLPFGLAAVAVCYDVEFPELVRAAARAGAVVLFVPSWTDDVAGASRVRSCARARCIENGIVVVSAPLVGSLPEVRYFEQARGRAAVFSPCDFGFPENGILAQGDPNADDCVIAEVDLCLLMSARASGTVTPLADSRDAGSYVVTS